MIVAYFFFEFIATYFESFMCYYFGFLFSSDNETKKINYTLPMILTIIILCLNRIKLFSAYTMLFAVIFVFVTETIFLKIHFMEAITISFFFIIILNVFDGFTVTLLSVITNNEELLRLIVAEYSFYRLLFIYISKVLFFLSFYVMKRYLLKSFKHMKITQKYLVSIMGIGGMIFLLKSTFEHLDIRIFFCWGMFLFAIIISTYAIYWFVSYKEERLNSCNIRFNQYMIEKRYEILMQDYKNNAQNFHDLKNHMLIIYKLLDDKNITQAENYVKQFVDADNCISSFWSGNQVLDYILNIKKKTAEKYNIDFTVDVDYINKFDISDKVICSIFTNLLDNAIEACNKISDKTKFVYVAIRRINNFIIIKVTNSIDNEPVIKNKIMVSSKHGINHGWGYNSIISSVQSNNGVISYNFNKEKFEVNITFFG
jgi:signal transduction histidine kinase